MSTKRNLPKLALPVVTASAKPRTKVVLDESRTIIAVGGDALESRWAAHDGVDLQGGASGREIIEVSDSVAEDSVAEDDVAMDDVEAPDDAPICEEIEDDGEPSFGDLVRANASEPIDVAGAFEDPESRALSYPKPATQLPSGASLGTVLAQSLRTNDVSLLESCLHTTDVETIRATIQRLESPLAAKLLHKLAERLHKRPGRSGSLMIWVQWTLVTHGGYLATQSDLIMSLAELSKVIDGRSRGLQSLLSLKGKLDMLEAQIELRRSLKNQRRRFDDDDDDDDSVIYVEGDESNENAVQSMRLGANRDRDVTSDEDSMSEDMPTTYGEIADSDEDVDSSENGDLIDDEAVESEAVSDDEDEVDHDDEDSLGDEEESDLAPTSKIARVAGQISKKK